MKKTFIFLLVFIILICNTGCFSRCENIDSLASDTSQISESSEANNETIYFPPPPGLPSRTCNNMEEYERFLLELEKEIPGNFLYYEDIAFLGDLHQFEAIKVKDSYFDVYEYYLIKDGEKIEIEITNDERVPTFTDRMSAYSLDEYNGVDMYSFKYLDAPYYALKYKVEGKYCDIWYYYYDLNYEVTDGSLVFYGDFQLVAISWEWEGQRIEMLFGTDREQIEVNEELSKLLYIETADEVVSKIIEK